MFVFESVKEVVEQLEHSISLRRDQIGHTRTKLESQQLKSEIVGINEAIFFLKEYLTYQEKKKRAGSSNKVEPVDDATSSDLGRSHVNRSHISMEEING
jgi:hypothetical protein